MIEGTAEDLRVLLRQCATGDRTAFRAIYERQSPRLYALALRITRNPGAAADAVQEAMLQIWRNAARFDDSRGAPEAWMIGLVRYRAIDLVRRTGREVSDEHMPDPIDEDPDPFERLAAAREGAALKRCLEMLDPEKRRAVTLAFIDGLSHSELADRLETALGTVKSWIRRGLESLKKCLSG